MANILVVAAHPDDEILGGGGTFVRRISEGDRIFSLVLGEGITSRDGISKSVQCRQLAALHKVNQKVADFMGFSKNWLLDFPDNRFDSVDLLTLIKAVEKVKKEVRPEIVFTHFEHDLNIDHRRTFQAVLTACRSLPGETVRELYSFETPSSTEWISSYDHSFRPNIFFDVERTIQKKVDAMALYESEKRDFPHPRSGEALKVIARRWGVSAGLNFAEAFILLRKIS